MIQYVSHRRGSNVSLTLDMCTPGCTEPYGYGAQLSPRDQSAQEYLRQGTHVLTPALLHSRAMDDQSLQAEFYVSAATAAHPPTRFRLTGMNRDSPETTHSDIQTQAQTQMHTPTHTHTPIGALHTPVSFSTIC